MMTPGVLARLLPPIEKGLEGLGLTPQQSWLQQQLHELHQQQKIPTLNQFVQTATTRAASSAAGGLPLPTPPLVTSLTDELWVRALDTSLTVCAQRRLPNDFIQLHKQVIPGTHLLEVVTVRDIAHSASELEERVNREDRMWKFELTDGVEIYPAMEKMKCPELTYDQVKVGVKFLIRDVPVRHGMLLLDPANVHLIGGGIGMNGNHSQQNGDHEQTEEKRDYEEKHEERSQPPPPLSSVPTTTVQPPSMHATTVQSLQTAATPTFTSQIAGATTFSAVASTAKPTSNQPRPVQPSTAIAMSSTDTVMMDATVPLMHTSTTTEPFVGGAAAAAAAASTLWTRRTPLANAPTTSTAATTNLAPETWTPQQQPQSFIPASKIVTTPASASAPSIFAKTTIVPPKPTAPPPMAPVAPIINDDEMEDEEALLAAVESVEQNLVPQSTSVPKTIYRPEDLLTSPSMNFDPDAMDEDEYPIPPLPPAPTHPLTAQSHPNHSDDAEIPVSQSMPALETAPPISNYVSPSISTGQPKEQRITAAPSSSAMIEPILTPPTDAPSSTATTPASSIPTLTPISSSINVRERSPASMTTTPTTTQKTATTSVKSETSRSSGTLHAFLQSGGSTKQQQRTTSSAVMVISDESDGGEDESTAGRSKSKRARTSPVGASSTGPIASSQFPPLPAAAADHEVMDDFLEDPPAEVKSATITSSTAAVKTESSRSVPQLPPMNPTTTATSVAGGAFKSSLFQPPSSGLKVEAKYSIFDLGSLSLGLTSPIIVKVKATIQSAARTCPLHDEWLFAYKIQDSTGSTCATLKGPLLSAFVDCRPTQYIVCTNDVLERITTRLELIINKTWTIYLKIHPQSFKSSSSSSSTPVLTFDKSAEPEIVKLLP